MLRRSLGAVGLFAVILQIAGCATGQAARLSPTETFKELLANPRAYDGRDTVVSGYLHLGPEARHLWSSREAFLNRTRSETECITLTNTSSVVGTGHGGNRSVIVSGTFHVGAIPDGVVDLAACGQNRLDLHAIRFE